MSGHSKWHNIQAKKGKADAARGKLFTKIGRELAVAAKGNPNPATNSKLADISAKAKAANMPNDNIERSIKKAAGELGDKEFKELTYEGYGVGGSAVIISTLTDNINRTASEVRSTMSKFGGSLGTTGSVSYMFDNRGLIVVEKTMSEDEIMDLALEAGAEDVLTQEDVYEIYTEPAAFSQVRTFLEGKGLEFLQAEISMIPQNKITLDPAKLETFKKMLERLEENDDVQDVYHNVDMPEEDDEEE